MVVDDQLGSHRAADAREVRIGIVLSDYGI
jgi:hypothetical protein